MPRHSQATRNVQIIADELRKGRKDAERKSKHVVPFMEEELEARDRRARIAALSPQERAALAERYGVDAAVKMWE